MNNFGAESPATLAPSAPQPTPQAAPTILTVSVMPKNVTLPDNTAELIAAVIPEAPEGSKYQVQPRIVFQTLFDPRYLVCCMCLLVLAAGASTLPFQKQTVIKCKVP